MRSAVAAMLLVGLGGLCAPAGAASTVFESADLGPTGVTAGNIINNNPDILGRQWIGYGFEVDESLLVTAIGGHLFADTVLFGAIVTRSGGATANPDIHPDSINGGAVGATLRAFVEFTDPAPGAASSDYRIDISDLGLVLEPGFYALVIGTLDTKALPANGLANNNPSNSTNPYLFIGSNTQWQGYTLEGDDAYVRIVLEGLTPVPVPAALPLFASALAGLGVVRWRRRRAAR